MMFRRLAFALLASALFAGCGKSDAPPAPSGSAPAPGAPAAAVPWKIGIVTGTVSQGEEEFRGGQKMVAKYGADRIVHVTYPDNFMSEQETTIAQVAGLAHDPAVKVIIICQAVPGTIPAIQKAKEANPNCLFIAIEPHDDPKLIARYADLVFMTNAVARGKSIITLAKKMGAKAFVHYSFPRHMSQELLKRRADLMKTECEADGIAWVYVNAPDPMSDQGLTGAQQFVIEDVPRQVARYGRDTAFFSTNCGMQEPIIRAALEQKAIFPEQCCPSPIHGYPGALGLSLSPEQAGDMKQILAAIKAKIAAMGGSGRFGTWEVPANMLFIEASVELAREQLDKGPLDRAAFTRLATDSPAVKKKLETLCGKSVQLETYEGEPHFYLMLMESTTF